MRRSSPTASPTRSAGLAPAPPALLADLAGATGDAARVHGRAPDRLSFARDASHYAITPQAVVVPRSADEVARLFGVAARSGVGLTFRSGGTSLGGQSLGAGILADTRRYFRDVEVLEDGLRVRVQPGAVLGLVNARLAPLRRKLGPDPASAAACTVGGVIADNSSGMVCGIAASSYATVESMILVLPGGTVVDTGSADADERLRTDEPALYSGLARLRSRIHGNPASVRTIREQFAMKNTMGYGLNSFLDYDSPADILAHLVVGSEGTLAFVAEATFHTVPVHRHVATGLAVFDGLHPATRALPAVVGTGPAAVELLDAGALRVAQHDPQAGDALRAIDVAGHAALLIEYQEDSAESLAERVAMGGALLDNLPLSTPTALTHDHRTRERIWHVRKGLYAAVAGARPAGTTALLEDIAVPVPALLDTCQGLTTLFEKHGYDDSVVFGHAKDGNLHFMLTERFEDAASVARYRRFTEDLVDLVLAHGGSLKAEHGTGRMMTPYVRRQYGDELYAIMCEVKRLCDPRGVANPGVIISDDADAHVQHLKSTPRTDPEIDGCVECGYCEPVCPSADLTITPRQRIVLRRARATAVAAGDAALVGDIDADYRYDGVQTCAVDGMCQSACPVSINTGDLVKRLRSEQHGPVARTAWRLAAGRWNRTTRAAATALDLAARMPAPIVGSGTRALRRLVGTENAPLWTNDLPRGGRARQPSIRADADAVLFSACTGSIFRAAGDGGGASAALVELCRLAGLRLTTTAAPDTLCCGTPWLSKGLGAGYEVMARRLVPELWDATRHGEIPIVCDASSCTEGLRTAALAAANGHDPRPELRVLDAVDFVHETVLPRLTVRHRLGSAAVHPTCSSVRLGLDDALRSLAAHIADEVVTPTEWRCCGFAGDRGLLHPELTAAATRRQAAELREGDHEAYLSCNRTCEIGMSRATGRDYRHIVEAVLSAVRDEVPSP